MTVKAANTVLIQTVCLFILGLQLVTHQAQAQADARPGAPVKATAYATVAPVMKGLPVNAVLHTEIVIPQTAGTQRFRALRLKLDPAALQQIDSMTLFLTGAEPFHTDMPVASARPGGLQWDMPATLTLKPGVHRIWISSRLKNAAIAGSKITVQCTALMHENGQIMPVAPGSGDFSRRIGVVVRKAGDEGVHTYRIPGIIATAKGTLLAVYDIRYINSRDLPANIDVGLSRSTDGGQTWEPMKIIMDMGAPHDNNGVGDPAILYDPVTEKIWVAALWSKGNRSIAGSLPGLSPDSTGQLVLVSSTDDGLTWSAPQSITPAVKNPAWRLFFNGPGNGIAMQNGTLVFAAQYWDENKMPHSTIIYSTDHGKSWTGKLAGPKSNTTESQVVETSPGTLMLNMRDNRGGFRSIATTTDLGRTWTEYPGSYRDLQDPVCMASIIKAPVLNQGKQQQALFFSNANTGSGRFNITIKASLNLGQRWPAEHSLLIDERPTFGYSCLTGMNNNTVGLLYEGIRDLYFVPVPVKDIIR